MSASLGAFDENANYQRLLNQEMPSVRDDDALIAVMGPTGSGKTTFINKASSSNLRVGTGLHSCTSEIQVSSPFTVDDREVMIVDTPGFDDTTLSDTDILKLITAFLTATYKNGKKLAGIIYMHRISDFKMGGMSARNFRMFRELCGESSLKNVVVVTNMWGEVTLDIGEARESELREDFFKSTLEKGAKLVRHYDTVESAHNILRQIINNKPRTLKIQREIVDEGKDISETAAGGELTKELAEQAKRHKEELINLQKEMHEAMLAQDEQTKKELGEEYQKLAQKFHAVEEDSRRLANDFAAERLRMEERMLELQEKARQEAERAAETHRQQIEILTNRLNESASTASSERQEMLEELAIARKNYEEAQRRKKRSICVVM